MTQQDEALAAAAEILAGTGDPSLASLADALYALIPWRTDANLTLMARGILSALELRAIGPEIARARRALDQPVPGGRPIKDDGAALAEVARLLAAGRTDAVSVVARKVCRPDENLTSVQHRLRKKIRTK